MKSKNNSYYKVIIFLFIASLLFYAVFVSYNYYTLHVGNVEKFNDQTPQVALFYATWCGHCTKYKESGVFDQASKSAPSNVKFNQYDYDKNTELAGKYDVQAFPTIVLIDSNGKLIKTFDGDIYDEKALLEFAQQTK
jgi:thioredoxin-like negative regulator of GroEL